MATLDDTNQVCGGGRVLIRTTIADAQTGVAPVPLPDVVAYVFMPDASGATDYTQIAALSMTDDGPSLPTDAMLGEKYSASYQVPIDGAPGAWKTQIAMNFDGFSDLSLRSSTFWVVT